jgi:hypothetical protein
MELLQNHLSKTKKYRLKFKAVYSHTDNLLNFL